MPFHWKKRLVGLDIGSETIKAAKISKKKKKRRLENFGIQETPEGAFENGVLKDSDIAAQAIAQLFENHQFKQKEIAMSISGLGVIAKRIKMPAMSEDHIFEAIRFESDQYLPYRIDEVEFDFQVIGPDKDHPGMLSVILVAAKKKLVKTYIDTAVKAGLVPRLINLDTFALQNMFEATHGPTRKPVALMDIGSTKTSLSVISDGAPGFMMDIFMGCRQITEKISSSMNCSMETARQLAVSDFQTGLPGKTASPDQIREIIRPEISDWHSEIKNAIDFFNSSHPDEKIAHAALSGGGAHIAEFHRLLGETRSMNISIFDPLSQMMVAPEIRDDFPCGQASCQGAICMGLGMERG